MIDGSRLVLLLTIDVKILQLRVKPYEFLKG